MKLFKIIFILLSFFVKLNAIAQDFEVSPAILDFKIDPFETQIKTISITNHSNTLSSFTISYSDYIFDKYGNKEPVDAKSTENSCIDWLIPDQDLFEIAPNQTFTLNISMQVPIDDFKAHWGYIYIQEAKEQTSISVDKETSTGLNLVSKIAINVVRTPKTEQEAKMFISNLVELEDKDKPNDQKEKRMFSVNIENKGNNIYDCDVLFIASNLSNAEETELPKIKIKSYPNFPRTIYFTLPENLNEGEYSLVALLDYSKKETLKGTRLNKNLIIVK